VKHDTPVRSAGIQHFRSQLSLSLDKYTVSLKLQQITNILYTLPMYIRVSVSQNLLYCQKMFHFLHTTILTMCTAKKVNLNLEAKAPLRCRLS
jgi:hypothetical protein